MHNALRTTISLRVQGNNARLTFIDETGQTLGTLTLDTALQITTVDQFTTWQKHYENRPNRLQDKDQTQLKALGQALFNWLD